MTGTVLDSVWVFMDIWAWLLIGGWIVQTSYILLKKR